MHSTFIFFTASLIAIFSGHLVDLKGSKWGLVVGGLWSGFFILMHSLVPNFNMLLVIAAFTGIAISINLPATSKAIVEYTPKNRTGTALGIQSSAFPVGGMLGSMFLPLLGSYIGWRYTILIPGVIVFLYGLFLSLTYQDKRKIHFHKPIQHPSFREYFRPLTKNIGLMSISVFGFFLGAINGAIVAHFTLFLYLDYGLKESIAGIGFAFLQAGSILGRPGWCYICDRFVLSNKRKTFMYMAILFAFLCIILGLFLRKTNPSLWLLFFLAFLIGCTSRGWQGLYSASVAETVDEQDLGTALGFSSLFFRFGMTVAPPIFGFIADIKQSYDWSWLFLGMIFFLTSVIQYEYSQLLLRKRSS